LAKLLDALTDGVLLNFPLARATPEVWRYGVKPKGLTVRAYDLYRRRVPSHLRRALSYDDQSGILLLDKGGLSGDVYDVDVMLGVDYVAEAQSSEYGEEQHEANFLLLSEAAKRLGSRLVPVVPTVSERIIAEYARLLELLEKEHLELGRFEIVALDIVRYVWKGPGALGARHYEDLAAAAATARRTLGPDRILLVAGLSPASMIVACHGGVDLLATFSWVSAAQYGRLILSTAEQLVPANLSRTALREKLANCSCPVCKIGPRDALLEYLELRTGTVEECLSTYAEKSARGFRARCIHNAHALVEMVETIRKAKVLGRGKLSASSFLTMGFHLPGHVMAGLQTVDRIRASGAR